MVEKPSVEEAPSNLIMIGVYILPKKIFKEGEMYLPVEILENKDEFYLFN